jgi:hypothetical protein
MGDLAFERTAGGQDVLRERGRGGGEGDHRGWGSGCRGGDVTGSDQDVAPLIDYQALACDEFVLYILQRRVVELELPLEGAEGHAAPLAHQGDHLIQNRDKVNPVSSLPGARPLC